MGRIEHLFEKQEEQEDLVSLKAMLIQISVNLVFTLSVLILFSWMRPRHPVIYAPKAKLSKFDPRRPITLNSGWFDWIKPVLKIKDDALLAMIGFDAYVFIYFTKMLRKLIAILTTISMFVFLPINIIATCSTGDWPPAPGLDFMSISAINYQEGKQSEMTNNLWYWSPTVATYVFSVIVIFETIRSSEKFLLFRKRYYLKCEQLAKEQMSCSSPTQLLQHQKEDLISRTLLVHFEYATLQDQLDQTASTFTASDDMKALIDSMTKSPCEQVLIGKYNSKLYHLIKDYNEVIKKMERHLNSYLYLVKTQQLRTPLEADNVTPIKRPTIRLNWKSMKKIDAINYYTERALSLNTTIRRHCARLQTCSYGWVVYPSCSIAHESFVSIQKHMTRIREKLSTSDPTTTRCISLRLAPQPEDIIWANMNIEQPTVQLKRWFGYGLFFSIVFLWSLPIAMLAVTSNMINLIRFFPKSDQIIDANQLLMGLIQSYLTPCLMVLFHLGLPELLRLVSRQQAYKTKSIVEQRLLSKLYTIFVANNLFVFTLVNMMLGILGQISAMANLGNSMSKNLSEYVVHIANNMTDISSFWINYVCLRSVGVVFELIQIVPLFFIVALKGRSSYKYTPRQLTNVIGRPPYFEYGKNYSLVLSFFTAALAYSVSAPIVLPFAMIYFGLATTTFKYKMMYIYVTKTETYGTIWPMLYSIVMVSLIVFQCMMILILNLKAGLFQIYSLMPLPIVTVMIGVFYVQRLRKQSTLKAWVELKNNISSSRFASNDNPVNDEIELQHTPSSHNDTAVCNHSLERNAELIHLLYTDPALTDPLWKPMLYDHIKYLVPDVYKDHPQQQRILRTLYSSSEKTNEAHANDYHTGNICKKTRENSQTPSTSCEKQRLALSLSSSSGPMNPIMTTTATTDANDEKLQIKQQIERIEAMYPPSMNPRNPDYYHDPLHGESSSNSNSNYYHHCVFAGHVPEGQPSSFSGTPTPTAPTLEAMLDYNNSNRNDNDDRFVVENEPCLTDPHLPPPPTYADVVLPPPRVNQIRIQSPQKNNRRHSA